METSELSALTSIVDGKPVVSAVRTVTSANPADTGTVVAEVRLAGGDGIVDACRTAKASQRAWGDVPAPVRGQMIADISRLVEANAEALARLVTREVGKPIAEARGNGKSANGSRQSWQWVLDQFTRWQSLNWDYSGRLQKARMEVAILPADLGSSLD